MALQLDFKKVWMIINYLEEKGGRAKVDEFMSFFNLSRKDLDQLTDTIMLCGFPPYTPDELFWMEIENGEIVFYSPRDIKIPADLNYKEAFALLFALYLFNELIGKHDERFSKVLSKIIKALPETYLDSFEKYLQKNYAFFFVAGTERKIIESVISAIQKEEAVKIQYYPISKHEVREYYLLPERIKFEHGKFYLLAKDLVEDKEKIFFMENVVELSQLDPCELNNLKSSSKNKNSLYTDEVAVEISGAAARYFKETFSDLAYTEVDDEKIQVVFNSCTPEWLISRWILPFAGCVKIIKPDNFREKVREKLLSLIDQA